MTIAIDFVGTNLGSGTKTYNINFCNELSSLDLTQNVKIFICKNYLKELSRKINENNQIEYVIKPNFLSITLLRLLWMQFIFPFQLKLMGIKTKTTKDSIKIYGNPNLRVDKEIVIKNFLKDHRVFMTSVIAALSFGGKWTIHDKDSVKTSFPTFLKILNSIRE